jgi:putative polyhydroxyalkanoate system protein
MDAHRLPRARQEPAMSTIEIRHPHSLAPEQARQAVEDFAIKLGQRFGLDYRWEGDELHFKRAGVDGHIALLPGYLLVSARLGMLFSAMKAPIEQEMRRVLTERLG